MEGIGVLHYRCYLVIYLACLMGDGDVFGLFYMIHKLLNQFISAP